MKTGKNNSPRPPKHLAPATRKWWADVVNTYVLEPHHQRLLTLAAESWDRAQQARELVAKEGLTFRDRFGCPRRHPATAIETENKIVYARMLRELDLDVDPPSEGTRPPSLRRFDA
jgi:phage terminase small subunit